MDDRREAMLVELTAAMRRIHARRRLVRRAAAVAALGLAAAGLWTIGLRPPAAPGPIPTPAHRAVTVVGPAQRTHVIRAIDDRGLIELLREIDRPAGLIRSEGRAWISGRVTDAELDAS